MTRGLLLGMTVVASFASFAPPNRARACGGVAPCVAVVGAEGTAPSNVSALALKQLFGVPSEAVNADTVQVYRVAGGTETAIELTIVPVAGDLYELRFDPVVDADALRVSLSDAVSCSGSATVTLGPEAPLPSSLGTLEVSSGFGDVPAPVVTGECYDAVPAAWATVTLALASDAAPWADRFVYETLVDGVPYAPTGRLIGPTTVGDHDFEPDLAGGSWLGRGRDLVYAACWPEANDPDSAGPFDEGVAQGHHTVRLVARLPGTDLVLQSPEVAIDLACPEPTPPDARGTCAAAAAGAHPGASGGTAAGGLVALVALARLALRRRRAR